MYRRNPQYARLRPWVQCATYFCCLKNRRKMCQLGRWRSSRVPDREAVGAIHIRLDIVTASSKGVW